MTKWLLDIAVFGKRIKWPDHTAPKVCERTVVCPVSRECGEVTLAHFRNSVQQESSPSHANSQHRFLLVRLTLSLPASFLPPWVSPDTGRQDSFWTHQPNSPGARAREGGVPLNTRQDWQSDRKRARPRQPVLPHCGYITGQNQTTTKTEKWFQINGIILLYKPVLK